MSFHKVYQLESIPSFPALLTTADYLHMKRGSDSVKAQEERYLIGFACQRELAAWVQDHCSPEEVEELLYRRQEIEYRGNIDDLFYAVLLKNEQPN